MEYFVFIVSYYHISKLLLSSGFSRRLLEEEVSFLVPYTSSPPPLPPLHLRAQSFLCWRDTWPQAPGVIRCR